MENKDRKKFDKCEVCGKESEDNSGFCDECFDKPSIQRALFKLN